MVDPNSSRFVYQQIADDLGERIKRGDLLPGQRLPSETELQRESGTSRGTVRRAVEESRGRRLAVTVPHRGTFVVHCGGAWM